MLLIFFLIPLTVAAFVVSKPNKRCGLLTSLSMDCNAMTKESLRGKNIILTGASSGLGKSLAFQLAKCDIKVLVLSGRNVEQLESVKTKCEDIMGSDSNSCVEIATCDLSDEASVEKFSNEAMEICKENVDVLLLCGGISSRSSFLETKYDVDKMLMQVNFLSGSAIAKCVVPSMVQKRSGNIIWVSSIQGLLGTPFRTSYAASKFAVQGKRVIFFLFIR